MLMKTKSQVNTRAISPFYYEKCIKYPMLWCGANLASRASPLTCSMHQASTHSWHKVIEHKVKKISSSDSVPSRVIAGLSGDIIAHKKIAPLRTRPWDKVIYRVDYLTPTRQGLASFIDYADRRNPA